MFNNKKGRMMRHPYLSLTIFSLAAVGAIGISRKTKEFFREKTKYLCGTMKPMKRDEG